MPSTISGPGFSGASELGAVSVGVVLDQGQLAASLEAAKAQIGAAAPGFADEGQKAGEAHGRGVVGGVLSSAGRLRVAMRSLHHLLYVSIAAGAIKGAHDLGHAIGTAIFRGAEDRIEKEQTALVEATKKTIDTARQAAFGAVSKAQETFGLPPVDVAAMEARAKEIEKLNKQINDLNKHIAATKALYKDADAEARKYSEHDPRRNENANAAKGLLDDEIKSEQKLNQLTAERTAKQAENTAIKQRGNRLTEEEVQLQTQVRQEAARTSAQRDVDLTKLITAISQLENVMRVVVQQRVPSSPGSTVIRGGP